MVWYLILIFQMVVNDNVTGVGETQFEPIFIL